MGLFPTVSTRKSVPCRPAAPHLGQLMHVAIVVRNTLDKITSQRVAVKGQLQAAGPAASAGRAFSFNLFCDHVQPLHGCSRIVEVVCSDPAGAAVQ